MKKKVYSVLILVMMLIGTQVFALASSETDVIISLPGSTTSYTYKSVTRSKAYSYVSVKIDTVYPKNGGVDTYKNLYVGLFNISFGGISNVELISEERTGYTNIDIGQGNLNLSTVMIGFRNPYGVSNLKAVVNYNGN